MRNYIILNNQRSDEISGLIIQELAPISKPLQRTQVETIDGRDGDIVTPLGYAAYDKKITIGLYGDFDINEIIAYFATKGTAIFSNEPDKYYNYQIFDQIDYERLVRFRVATVTMHVQPFKYSATEGTITVGSSDTVSGEGSNIMLENTAEAPFNVLRHKGNAIQDGTPTPSAPVPVQTVTGRQTVTVTGKNLYDPNSTVFSVPANVSVEVEGNSVKVTALITTTSSNLYWRTPIPDAMLEDGKTYTISSVLGSGAYRSPRLLLRNHDGSNAGFSTGYSVTYDSRYTLFVVENPFATTGATQVTAGTTCTISNIQVELGSTATAFEPYRAQEYEINLGKNLFDKDNANILQAGITTTKIESATANRTLWIPCEPSTTYTIQKRNDGDTNRFNVATTAVTPAIDVAIQSRTENPNASSITYTTSSTAKYLCVQYYRTAETILTEQQVLDSIQIEKGSTASSYSAYFTPIKLAAIGDYVDEPVKVGDTWYIRRAVGKVVLDGSEDWHKSSNTQVDRYWYNIYSGDVVPAFHQIYSDKFFYEYNVPTVNAMWVDVYQTLERLFVNYAPYGTTTVTDLKTWLASNPTTVYYPLATPTDEEITDQALIDALDDFYEQAHAYKGRTHITATAQGDNAPAILSVEVNENNESTIVNSGNTTSRPIITIYGQGDIGMYINDVQVLDIALGDEQYITIDSVAMEAYKGTTANLKNRLVTGDYSKLALNAGDNKIYFTGKVTKYEISKYSRWL